MPYYDVVNLVTITKMTMIDEIPWSYGTLRTTAVRIWLQDSHRAAQRSQLLLKSLADLHRGPSCSRIWLSYMSSIVVSCLCLHNCRWFQEHQRMLFHRLRALCPAPADPTTFWNHWDALVISTKAAWRFGCFLWINLYSADVSCEGIYCHSLKLTPSYISKQRSQYSLNGTKISGMPDLYTIQVTRHSGQV